MSTASILVIAATVFVAMCAAAALGIAMRERRERKGQPTESESSQEGYIVSAVLGLLALLIGFTFSLAVDRFDARRLLVLEEANAIRMTYLRAQLLEEPHRSRMTDLLVRYTDNRIALAKAGLLGQNPALLSTNDALITDIWAATSAAFESIKGLDFSSTYLDSVNKIIDLDAARKAARRARVPAGVFFVLFVYLVTSAGVMGHALKGGRGRLTAGFLLALFTLVLMLIIDIDRPIQGSITEGQQPMEDLRKSFSARPPAIFDRWRSAQR